MDTPITSHLDTPASLPRSTTPQPTRNLTWMSTFQSLKRALFNQWGAQVWQRMVNFWSHPPELHVWQRRDRAGQSHWHIYDPVTNQSACFGSEADVKAWINDHLAQRQSTRGYGWGSASLDVSLHQASPFR